MKRSTYNAVLKLVNEILVRHGKKPVKKLSPGFARQETSCPITQTLLDGSFAAEGAKVKTTRFYIKINDKLESNNSDLISEFTREVDSTGDILRDTPNVVKDTSGHCLVDPNTLIPKPRKKPTKG